MAAGPSEAALSDDEAHASDREPFHYTDASVEAHVMRVEEDQGEQNMLEGNVGAHTEAPQVGYTAVLLMQLV